MTTTSPTSRCPRCSGTLVGHLTLGERGVSERITSCINCGYEGPTRPPNDIESGKESKRGASRRHPVFGGKII